MKMLSAWGQLTGQQDRWSGLRKWLALGMGVKRWLLAVAAGILLLGLGLASLLVEMAGAAPSGAWYAIVMLGGLPLWLRLVLLIGAGLLLGGIGIAQLGDVILSPLGVDWSGLADVVVEHRRGQSGPKIVAVGGGTGLPVLLRGLKQHTSNLTAVVTVADDGGSSGKLRRDLGVLPPGDFRNNIAALARDEGLMTQLFQYRFGEGGLEGHSFGNLFITALSEVTGSFEEALAESSRVLAIKGQVLPSTLSDVTLVAELREDDSRDTRRVEGESAIPDVPGAIQRVFIQPEDAPAYPEAVKAILFADVVVLGPGSLFTSILPNLMVKGIASAIQASKALKIYVCNVATQRGETEGFSVGNHVEVIERHVGEQLLDVVLVNNRFPELAEKANFDYVREAGGVNKSLKSRIVSAPLADKNRPWRHDSEELARAVIKALETQIQARRSVGLELK